MRVNYEISEGKHLKIIVAKNNNIRFRIPKNSKIDTCCFERIVNKILQNPDIMNCKFSLIGRLQPNIDFVSFASKHPKDERTSKYIGVIYP